MQSKMFRLMFLILRRISRGALFLKPRGTPALISSCYHVRGVGVYQCPGCLSSRKEPRRNARLF
jgi:hypothetical protein